MTTFTRKDWGARPPKASTPLVASEVEGIAIHWPGTGSTKPIHGVDAVGRAIRAWQNLHMDDHGWSDVAYQEAIDQDGNVYDLRGLATRSAANGDEDVNRRFGAILLVLAEGEQPSAAMIATTRARIAEHRRLFPKSHRIVGHQEIRPEPTACPGPAAEKLIKAGAFEPTREPSTPNITAFRNAKTRTEKRAAAKQVAEHGALRAKAAARAWLEADVAMTKAANELIAQEAGR